MVIKYNKKIISYKKLLIKKICIYLHFIEIFFYLFILIDNGGILS